MLLSLMCSDGNQVKSVCPLLCLVNSRSLGNVRLTGGDCCDVNITEILVQLYDD